MNYRAHNFYSSIWLPPFVWDFMNDIMDLVIDVVLMLLTFLWLCQWILSYSQGINMVKHKNFVMVPKTYKNKNVESYIWFSKCNKISFVPSLDDKNELNLRKTFFNQNCVILVSMLLSKLGRGLFSVNYSIFATSI